MGSHHVAVDRSDRSDHSGTTKDPAPEAPRAVRARLAGALHTRLRGCLLGGALGDALGSPVEFMALAEIRRRFGAHGISGFGPASSGIGEITDDTQMTLFTAEGILRTTARHMEYGNESEPKAADWDGKHRPHPAVMWHAYRRWLHTQREKRPAGSLTDGLDSPADAGWLVQVEALHARRAPGDTCLSALPSSRWTGGSVERPINNSKGCGSVMRVAPIGVVPCKDPFGYAVIAAALTHGHPSGYLPAGAYAQIVSDLYFDQVPLRAALERALVRLAKESGHEETSRALVRARELADQSDDVTPERVQKLGLGWTAEEALAIGLYCALVAKNFEHGVRLAVNHSGDSDSTGTIAGSLLGVQCGEYGIPADWLARLQLRDVISTLADDLVIGYGGGPAWRKRYPGC